MENNLITKENERVVFFFKALDRMLSGIERMAATHKPTLNGEQFLTDKEVCLQLKVTRQTMQDWRNNGKIAYIHLGGKILYRQSDIQSMLEKNLREVWK